MADQFEKEALEISLGLQAYDSKLHLDPVILQPELHVKPCPVCDQFGHKAVDCPELCPLCTKGGDCKHIMDGFQWKGHPDNVNAEEDLPNFDKLTTIDHTLFALILLKSLAKDLAEEKEVELQYEKEKVRAKAEAEQITKYDNLIGADMAEIHSVARIPAQDP
jgi:hypothetical protein